MRLVTDAAPLVALADEREPRREEILELLHAVRGSLFIPPTVTAEIQSCATFMSRLPSRCSNKRVNR